MSGDGFAEEFVAVGFFLFWLLFVPDEDADGVCGGGGVGEGAGEEEGGEDGEGRHGGGGLWSVRRQAGERCYAMRSMMGLPLEIMRGRPWASVISERGSMPMR